MKEITLNNFVIDLLLKNYSFITHLVEAIAALAGVLVLNKFKGTHARYFIFFLVYIAVFDTLGYYTKYVASGKKLSFLVGTIIQKNHWLYNIFWHVGAIMFFSFYYRKILKTAIFLTIIKCISYCFLVFCIIYFLYNWEAFFHTFFPTINVLGAIVIFTCTVFYFIEILQSDKILEFYKSINFYISAAIFIWWLIITPIVFYNVYHTYEIGNPNIDLNFLFLRRQIYLFANLTMYLTFTFALLWCKPQND